jgi:hypothetical protein
MLSHIRREMAHPQDPKSPTPPETLAPKETPMKLTNIHNLPQAFVDAVEARPYIRQSDLSVTELVNPLQKTILTHRYYDQLEEDAIDRVWALLGSAAHEVLSRSTEGARLIEERLFATFCTEQGFVTTSGQPDRIDADLCIRDFKVTSAWTIVYDTRREEWNRQLSYYRVLAIMCTGLDVKDKGEIVVIIRDFNKHQAGQGGYPELPVCVIPIELLDFDTAYKQMYDYCAQYLLRKELPDAMLPPCTAEERWTQPDKWALFKNETNKRATRVYDDEGEAHAALAEMKEKEKYAYLEKRPGGPRRCEEYCPVAKFCSQYQSELQHGEAA